MALKCTVVEIAEGMVHSDGLTDRMDLNIAYGASFHIWKFYFEILLRNASHVTTSQYRTWSILRNLLSKYGATHTLHGGAVTWLPLRAMC